MTRTIVFLMTLMSVLPFDGSAQAVPSPGDRIRIKQVDGTVLTGTLAALSPQTIQLLVGSDDRMAEIPVARIEALEISLGRQRRFLKYFGLTVAAGLVLGATSGGIFWEPCSFLCFTPFQTETRGTAIRNGFGIGALVGLPLGAIIGSNVREERWDPVSLPAPAESRLTIRPVMGSGVGFAGSVRVGGF